MNHVGRYIVIVLDSFGVGAMDDVPEVRPADRGSNTAFHIIEQKPQIKVDTLVELGLMNAIGRETDRLKFSPKAIWGKANLGHRGADSFLGHQEIMGTTPPIPLNQAFNDMIEEVEQHLKEVGYRVRKEGADDEPKILVVNDAATVGDNLETDLGQVFNVSACLDLMPFDEVKKLGRAVRDVVKISRVIAFGGEKIRLNNLLKARKVKGNQFAGVDAPASGVYNTGYQVIHLGYGIDPEVQIPTILDNAHIPVTLVGKVGDIVQTTSPHVFLGVDTNDLFDHLISQVKKIDTGFFCLNIQETDLAGHAEDVERYADRLQVSDRRIKELMSLLNEEDILIVTADHGNDPTIGHSQHTREFVPLLIYRKGIEGQEVGIRDNMSDTAATAAEYFHVSPPQHGQSYLSLIQNT